jgi:hypothetical protein
MFRMGNLAAKFLSALDAIGGGAPDTPVDFLKRQARRLGFVPDQAKLDEVRRVARIVQCADKIQNENSGLAAQVLFGRQRADFEEAVAAGRPVPVLEPIELLESRARAACEASGALGLKYRAELAAAAVRLAQDLADKISEAADVLEKTERKTCDDHGLLFSASPGLNRLRAASAEALQLARSGHTVKDKLPYVNDL